MTGSLFERGYIELMLNKGIQCIKNSTRATEDFKVR